MAAPDTEQVKAIVFDCFGVLYLQSYRNREMVRNQTLIDLIPRLRARYRIGLLSNMSQTTMDRYFTEHERGELFDAVVLSGEVGLRKPRPEVFDAVLRKLAVEPAAAIYIDDDDTNVLSAKGVGMKGVRYHDTGGLIRDFEEYGISM